MRKAFSLIEMMVVVATLPLVMVLVSRVFVWFGREIPKSTQLLLEQGVVAQVLDQIRQDVDEAKALPRSQGEWVSGGQNLLIEKADGVVLYQIADGKVTKTMLGPGNGLPEPVTGWAIPNASIQWRLWGRGGSAYAVEVHTHLVQKLRARSQERLANSHVLFLADAPKEVAP